MGIKEAPPVVKVFFTLWILGLAIGAIGTIALEGSGFWMLPIATVAVVFGIFLVLDLAGAARGLAATTATNRPWGVDYSRSIMAKPAFARFFGAMMIVVGVGFALGAVSEW